MYEIDYINFIKKKYEENIFLTFQEIHSYVKNEFLINNTNDYNFEKVEKYRIQAFESFREIYEKFEKLKQDLIRKTDLEIVSLIKDFQAHEPSNLFEKGILKELKKNRTNLNSFDELEKVLNFLETGIENSKKNTNHLNLPAGFPFNIWSNEEEGSKEEDVIIEKTTKTKEEEEDTVVIEKGVGDGGEVNGGGDAGGDGGDGGDGDKGDDDPPLRKTIAPIRKGRFFGSAAVIAGLVAVWYFWGGLVNPATWLAKETNYSIAEDLVLRSSPNAENDDNKIDALYYGAKVSVLKSGAPWTKVKFDDKKGYVHSKYLIDEVDYTILNSAFEDSETLRFIPKSRYKKAILSYYLTNGICGKLSTEEQERIFGKGITKPIWTIKAYYSANENWVRCDQKVYNSASIYNDLVFIIKSANNERKIVLYSFLPDETPFLLDVQDYPYKFPIVNYWYNPNGTYGKDKLQYECSNLNQNYNGY